MLGTALLVSMYYVVYLKRKLEQFIRDTDHCAEHLQSAPAPAESFVNLQRSQSTGSHLESKKIMYVERHLAFGWKIVDFDQFAYLFEANTYFPEIICETKSLICFDISLT